jgi:hypothetical protein
MRAEAESFCSCATDSGTSVGAFKNSECASLGVPRFSGELDCDDAEAAEYGALSGAGSLTDVNGFGCRGAGSLLAQRYGATAAGCGWAAGEPASPTYGAACPNPAGVCGGECEPAVWLAGNPLQAPGNFCLAMLSGAGDAAAIFGGASEPSAALAGSRSLVLVVQAGQTNGLWASGSAPLAFETHTFAISKLVAFPANIESSGVLAHPWKGDQCGDSNHCTDTWLGLDSGASLSHFPFVGTSIYTLDNCEAARTGATYVVGSAASLACNGSQIRLVAPSNYTRSTDWPFGAEGLVQVAYKGFGTASMEWIVLFTPAGGARKTLFHATGFDARGASPPSPYNPNAYANANQGGGETPTTVDTGRVVDNLLIQSWTAGQEPADVVAAMPTASQMELGAASVPTLCCR